MEPLLSLTDVTGVLGVSRITLWRLVNQGALPVVKIGSRTLFRRDDVKAFIDRSSFTRDRKL